MGSEPENPRTFPASCGSLDRSPTLIRVYRLAHGGASQRHEPFHPSTSKNHWNSGGVPMAYAAENVALCALEILSKWSDRPDLTDYELYAMDLEEDDVLDVTALFPGLDLEDRERTREIGDAWIHDRRSLALRVPSTVVPFSSNFLINPEHPHFDPGRVQRLGSFDYDRRVLEMVAAAQGDETPEASR